ncbi:MAG: CoA transferase [Deltaproteobacteria bacterium]|nr:CoA transferase [Deltaproteobacteria bacterium]
MTALTGLRVVDLSRYAPGPYCTMLLADFGADVIVVEEPVGAARRVDAEMGVSERTRAFLPMERNKRSITLDLKDAAAREAFLSLAERSDVVVEGFRPGVAARLGVDYEAVRARNPRIVYCSISGYGQTGPYATLVGHDLNYVSIAGVLGSIGSPGGPPAIPLNVIGDFAGGGLFAAFAVLAAIVAREKTGCGQYIDLAMSDGALSLACLAAADTLSTGEPPRPGSYYLNGALPCYSVYACADGKWLSVAAMEPWFWRRLCVHLDAEHLAEAQLDPSRAGEIADFLRRRFAEKSRDVWSAELRDLEACVTPVYDMQEALADAHNRARGMLVELEHAEFGTIRQVGIAPKLSATPGSVRSLAPGRGQHTEEVLRELGYDDARIDSLTRKREA